MITVSGVVSGTFIYPDVNLTMSIAGEDGDFDGTVSSDGKKMTGDSEGESIIFRKK